MGDIYILNEVGGRGRFLLRALSISVNKCKAVNIYADVGLIDLFYATE